MTAFLKIDRCTGCRRELPWEWVPPIDLGGRTLAGTGVWRSGLIEDLCPDCIQAQSARILKATRAHRKREQLITLLGGTKPFREFTFERFGTTAGNRAAFEAAVSFESERQNLYLWGSGGAGKTHLALAIARRAFWQDHSVVLTTPSQLVRSVRMKPPEEEQRVLDTAVRAHVLVLDAVGRSDSPFAQQTLQEILDARSYQERGGVVVTSRLSPRQLISFGQHDGVAARLASMCTVVELRGEDRRLRPNHG